MNKQSSSNTMSLALILLLVAGLIGAMFLSGRKTELRKGAYFSGAKITLQPESIAANEGENVPVQLWVESDLVTGSTTEKAKISSVDTKLCFGDGLILDSTDLTTLIDLNNEAFRAIEYAKVTDKCLRLVVASTGIMPENLKSGLVKVASIRFKAIKAGSGVLSVDMTKTMVAGYNPTEGATDTSMKIASAAGASYVITSDTSSANVTPTSTPSGNAPYLKFLISFLGVRPDAKCADGDKMPLTVTVRAADGTIKNYPNVIPAMVTSNGDLANYEVKLSLEGFNYRDNIAVFVKGPKSLQGKYGIDNQDKYYDKAGGELTGLTNDPNTTKMFNFAKYPLLAGDVTGVSNTQDGQVDGLDFSYVKAESVKRTGVAEKAYMLADLNGNCQMESQDVALLMLSLSVKQGQMY